MDPIEKTQDEMLDERVERVEEALDRHDVGTAVNTIEALETLEAVDVFDELDVEDQAELMPRLDPETSADILIELHEDDQAALAKRMTDETLADVLDEMEPDDAADVIGDLPEERQGRVLNEMDVAAADDVRELLTHAEDTAGGVMTNHIITLQPMMTAEQAINRLREWGPGNETAYYLYVTDDDDQLVGIVSMRALITAQPSRPIREFMSPDVRAIPVGTDQEEAARILQRYGYLAMPVTDNDNKLVGVITVDDAVEVIEEEAVEDTFRLSGMANEERVFSPISTSMKKRLPWLGVNLLTAFLAAAVYNRFTNTIEALPFLAALPSMVAGQGGNAATQRITILVRGLATGEADLKDAKEVILKEMWIGLLQGLALALVVGGGVALWQGSWLLGAIIGVAMIANLVVAGFAGTAVPFVLRAVKQDPALSSAVIVTTFTDCCGFAFSLGLATFLIHWLK